MKPPAGTFEAAYGLSVRDFAKWQDAPVLSHPGELGTWLCGVQTPAIARCMTSSVVLICSILLYLSPTPFFKRKLLIPKPPPLIERTRPIGSYGQQLIDAVTTFVAWINHSANPIRLSGSEASAEW